MRTQNNEHGICYTVDRGREPEREPEPIAAHTNEKKKKEEEIISGNRTLLNVRQIDGWIRKFTE